MKQGGTNHTAQVSGHTWNTRGNQLQGVGSWICLRTKSDGKNVNAGWKKKSSCYETIKLKHLTFAAAAAACLNQYFPFSCKQRGENHKKKKNPLAHIEIKKGDIVLHIAGFRLVLLTVLLCLNQTPTSRASEDGSEGGSNHWNLLIFWPWAAFFCKPIQRATRVRSERNAPSSGANCCSANEIVSAMGRPHVSQSVLKKQHRYHRGNQH